MQPTGEGGWSTEAMAAIGAASSLVGGVITSLVGRATKKQELDNQHDQQEHQQDLDLLDEYRKALAEARQELKDAREELRIERELRLKLTNELALVRLQAAKPDAKIISLEAQLAQLNTQFKALKRVLAEDDGPICQGCDLVELAEKLSRENKEDE